MSLRGRPDFSTPLLASGAGEAWAAFEDPRHAWVPADALALACEAAGAPAFVLERLPYVGADGPSVLGLASARFAPTYGLPERQAALFGHGDDRALRPIAADAAFLRFSAPAALALPEAWTRSRALGPDGAGLLGLQLALDADALRLLEEALAVGIQALDATLEWQAWGVGRRCDARVRVAPDRLAAWLRAQAPGIEADGSVLEALAAPMVEAGAEAGLAFSALDDAPAARHAAAALLERLCALHGRLVPAADPAHGAHHALDLAAFAGGRWDIDLAEPVAVPRAWVLASQPMLALPPRPLAPSTVLRMAHGMHTIGLSLNMPARRSGVLGLGVELLAPAFPPSRPQSATASARIPDGAVAVHLPLRLSPAEPLAFRWRCWALVGGPGGAPVRAIGDWREAEAAQLTPRPDQLPLGFARVSASPALLAVAAIALRLEGRVGDADFVLAERLDAAHPSVALALPPGLVDARLALFADSLDGGGPVALPDQPAADAWLDLHLLPGFAPQACTLQLDTPVAAPGHLEWCDAARRDSPGASRLHPLATGDAACTLRWLPADPLRPAIAWRFAAAPGAGPAPWSAPLSPGTHRIALDATKPADGPTPTPSPTPTEPAMDPIVLNAVAAFPVAGKPLHYQLLPLRPGLARTPAGAPQLQLLEAGALRLLQLTAAWGLADDEVDAARAALAGRLGVASERLVLEEHPATVAAYEIWLAGEDGALALAGSARGSGMGAQHAVFSLPLDAEQGARMRRALKGTRGQAWLRARFTASPDAARTSTSVAVDALWTRSAMIDGVASAAAGALYAEAHEASTPETALPAADADAADWTRPR